MATKSTEKGAGAKTKGATSTATNTKPSLGKVMVIGGNGFLGHHVVKLLVTDYDASVSVVDLRCGGRNRRPDSDGVAYYERDITDRDAIDAVFREVRPDVVIHTASPAVQASSPVSNELFKRVNVDGTRCIVEAAQKNGVKALVYTSSASTMSDNKSDLVNANEEWPLVRGAAQTEYYSETKVCMCPESFSNDGFFSFPRRLPEQTHEGMLTTGQAQAEDIVLAANRQEPYKLLTCSIRPAAMLGEGDTMLTYHLINIYRQGRTGIQVGDNNNLFDFTYIVNAAHAHLLAARALLATAASSTVPLDHERVDGEAFVVTNGEPMYFWDFCRAVWAAYGSPLGVDHVRVLPRPVGIALGFLSEVFFAIINKPPTFNRQRIIYSTMTRYFDISKARARLGYNPIVSTKEGIERAVRWFKELEAEGENMAPKK